MKTLLLIRHAKSRAGDFSVADFDRPLSERGKRDAPEMAQRLLSKKIKPDAFVSSPAKRARTTCKYFCDAYGVSHEDIHYIDKLYLASPETFFEVITGFPSSYNHVAVFSHNNGISEFANLLCDDVMVDEMPTCSVFAVEAPITEWRDFADSPKKFLLFMSPNLNS